MMNSYDPQLGGQTADNSPMIGGADAEISARKAGLLMGRKVFSAELASDAQDIVKLTTDGGEVYLSVDGDCCSESWYYAIENVPALIGGTVIGYIERELPAEYKQRVENDGKTRQDVDELYGFTLVTNKGRVDFEFRNSSNGYYGGDLTITDEKPNRFNYDTRKWDNEVPYISLKDDYRA